MKFTIGWLKEHLDTKYKDNKIIDKLTILDLKSKVLKMLVLNLIISKLQKL